MFNEVVVVNRYDRRGGVITHTSTSSKFLCEPRAGRSLQVSPLSRSQYGSHRLKSAQLPSDEA